MTIVEHRGGTGDEVRALRSTALEGDGVPARVLLSPWGEVESTNGDFIVDEEAARLVIEAFAAHGTDLPIDYEHQTLGGEYAAPNGQAPAAGWIRRVLAEPGVGLVAEIEWTEAARRRLASREYRYLSPVAVIRREDRKLVAIHSAALTNKPAIRGMEAIVNRAAMEVPSDGTSEPEAFETSPMAALRRTLGCGEEADAEDVLLAAGRRIADLEEGAKRRRVEERIREAMRAGKLVEAQRAWAEALVATEEGLFDEWLRCAPVIVRPGRTSGPASGAAESRVVAAKARARSEYRSNRMLAGLTSEEAYVAMASREQGLAVARA